jgi:hypothetical protein
MRRIPILAGGILVVITASVLLLGGEDPPPPVEGPPEAPPSVAPVAGHAAQDAPPGPTMAADRSQAAEAAVCGLVITETASRPVAGALVALRSDRGARTLHTDEAGTFCFRGLAPGRYDLVAQYDGRRSETVEGLPLEAGEEIRELALFLRDGVSVSGRIVDRRTGEGIPLARVRAGCETGFGFAEASSDRHGAFRLSNLPPGRHRLEVVAQGYADGELILKVEGARPVTGVSLILDPEARIGGRVLDPAGRPVAGAAVRAVPYRLTRQPEAVDVSGEGAATTREDGTFELASSPGVLALVASASGHGTGRVTGIEVAAGGRVDGVEVRLSETAGLLVDVRLPSGEPAAGARVRALCDGSVVCGKAEADAAGRAHLDDLAAGRVVVEAGHPGSAGRARVPVDVTAGVRRHLTIALSSTSVLAGQVVDDRGLPIPGATVVVQEMGADEIAGTSTGGDGRFFVEVPSDTPLSVVATTDGGRGERGGVRAGSEVRVVVRGYGRVVGWVTDASGRPITDASVTLVGTPGPDGEAPAWRQGRFASERGDFAFDDLMPGTYRLQASGPGHAPGEEVAVQVWAGADAGPVRLAVSAAGLVRGRVSSPDGRPVGGARVALEPGRLYGLARFSGAPGTAAETDAGGHFLLDGVPAGPARRVYAWHPDWRAGAGGPVAVAAGREAGPVEVRLRPRPRSRHPGQPPPAFGGVGMTLAMDEDGAMRIGEVFAGGPAFLAGLRDGDHVLSVDGAATDVLGLRGTLRSIRGPVGTDVTLQVERGGGRRFEVRMVRVELAM